jgi:salicylate hydroxylase
VSTGPKIAVIGGGIGGLTAAIALTRRGLAVDVYEQAPALKEVGAGVGLWPNALAALASIGLAGQVARLAVEVAGQDFRRPDGTLLMRLPADLMERRWGAGFVLVHRAELHQLLAAEVGSAVIHLGARCTGFRRGTWGVTAHFADGREAEADILIGADGVHSTVRAVLFGPSPRGSPASSARWASGKGGWPAPRVTP